MVAAKQSPLVRFALLVVSALLVFSGSGARAADRPVDLVLAVDISGCMDLAAALQRHGVARKMYFCSRSYRATRFWLAIGNVPLPAADPAQRRQ